jgi:2-polyprenyl-3-methyl-5-hydroxy-6-metoxy-1,4-benzoquinol methylase
VVGSALDLPFADQSFDVVIASQMTHHLDQPAEVIRHFAEAWRVARLGVVISDLHRNPLLYLLVAVAVRVLGFPPAMRSDGLVSVRRAFRLGEWQTFARAAGLTTAEVWLYAGTRLILQARKPELPGPP